MKFRRWLWVLAVVPMVVGLSRLHLDTEVLHLLPGDLPEVKGLKLWQENFGESRELLITLRAADAESASQAASSIASALRARTGLVAEVHWQAPWREHPGESAEIAAAAWLNSSTDDVAKLVTRLQPDQLEAELADLRNELSTSLSPGEIGRLSYDPLRLLEIPSLRSSAGQFAEDGPPFASEDGTFRVIHVEGPETFADYRAAANWLARVREVVEGATAGNPSSALTELRYTGGPVFLAEIAFDMERDMKRSVTGTAVVVALLFLLVHRRLKPLLWLIALLVLVLLATMAAGGLFFARLNVVSMGFAAILLGLAVDYGLVIYQERQAHHEQSLRRVIRSTAPGIWWSAITTAGAFALLIFGGLPGLAQLGSLVAVGIIVAAAVMLGWFMKPLEKRAPVQRRDARPGLEVGTSHEPQCAAGSLPADRVATTAFTASNHVQNAVESSHENAEGHGMAKISTGNGLVVVATIVVAVLALVLVVMRPPAVDATSEPLRPARSAAYNAMDEMRKEIGGQETWAVLVTGTNEQAVADRLQSVETKVARLKADKVIESAALPGTLWPNPGNQILNREPIRKLLNEWASITNVVQRAGFTSASLALAQGVINTWSRALKEPGTFWPDNSVSRWILPEMSARNDGLFIAAGAIKPGLRASAAWVDDLQTPNIFVAGWERLGPALLDDVETRLKWVLAGIIAVVLLTLTFTFRNGAEVGLSLGALLFSGLLLLALMSLVGWSWNLMNLMAVPLLLGSTVDYSIHTQLSLRRHDGDVRTTFAATGKAVLLCAATTAAGFGSLAFSSNAGLASLGKVCAVGATCAALTACFLLPRWWHAVGAGRHSGPHSNANRPREGTAGNDRPVGPSRFYGTVIWKLGMGTVRFLPVGVSRGLGSLAVAIYGGVARSRRRVVVENLLPVCGGERRKAEQAAGRLFKNFGIKIADLLRYESGRAVDGLFHNLPTPDQFAIDSQSGRGTLLLTIHLGNWEFGAPLLRRIGVNLLVITLAEPGRGFTELREAARKRWGVETLVVGRDAFAFVEVLKRLQEGAVIALLVDRPPKSGAVTVELFGRPFSASISAAELARASGCALIPVAIPWTPAGYEVISLPGIVYDRAELNRRDSRCNLTQEIVRAFEPVIRQHPDQWFHFVPIWATK